MLSYYLLFSGLIVDNLSLILKKIGLQNPHLNIHLKMLQDAEALALSYLY